MRTMHRVASWLAVAAIGLPAARTEAQQPQCRGTKQWYAVECRYPDDVARMKAEEARQQAEAARRRAEQERARDEADCQAAGSYETLDGWQDYVSKHPSGSCVEQARQRIAELGARRDAQRDAAECEKAMAADTLDAWQAYQSSHPTGGSCREHGKRRIAELEAEQQRLRDVADCSEAASLDTLDAWKGYLSRHADGACRARAEQILAARGAAVPQAAARQPSEAAAAGSAAAAPPSAAPVARPAPEPWLTPLASSEPPGLSPAVPFGMVMSGLGCLASVGGLLEVARARSSNSWNSQDILQTGLGVAAAGVAFSGLGTLMALGGLAASLPSTSSRAVSVAPAGVAFKF
ncbi:MAG: hypothetical protein HY744_05635 [Deltaproteobacteria bacterium]|nr:hypothetical protein [Deltaproteobacteria bacterium]